MAAPERIVPTRFESVMVAAAFTHHTTLHGWPPFSMTTLKPVPVSAPFTRNVHVALAWPCASSIKTPAFAVASTQ